MITRVAIAFVLMLSACASAAPVDLSAMQRRLDDRGLGFGVTRVPGHDAFVFQVRFQMSEAGEVEAPVDPMAAAEAAAPPGCSVASLEPIEDGLSYRVEYAC